jgi:hypothetical protein
VSYGRIPNKGKKNNKDTPAMANVEKEVQKVTGLKLAGKSREKNLPLAVQKLNDLPDDEWANLSEATQEWANKAIKAVKAKKEIPEFPDVEEDSTDGQSERASASTQDEEEVGAAAGAEADNEREGVSDMRTRSKTKATNKKNQKKQAATAARSGKQPAAATANKKTAASNKRASSGDPRGKRLEVIKLAQRKQGVTGKEAIEATGWPSISMPQQLAGYKYVTEKEGRAVRYRITG